ncbi:hypothetical protein BH10PSE7_BH10PSE7_10990 [soil metagenome]
MADSAKSTLRALTGFDYEAALSTVLVYSPAGILVVAIDGTIAVANDAFCRMSEYRRNELLRRKIDDLIHPDDATRSVRDRLNAIDARVGNYSIKHRFVRKGGTSLPVSGVASLQRDTAGGEPQCFIIQVTDTTVPKYSAPKSAALHEKLDIALAAGRIGVWEADLIQGHYEWDARMHELYGLPLGTYDGSSAMWDARVHPADLPTRTAKWDEALANATDADSEYRISRPDGSVRHIHSLYRIFRDKIGRPSRAIGANIDITEHKLATERALEEKERLTITLRSIGDAVICTDSQSHITFMNPVAEKLTGWSSSDAAGLRLLDVFNVFEERTGDPLADPARECILRGAPFKMESGAMLVTRKGGALDIGMSAAPVSASGSDFVGAIIVFNDITELRAIDKRMAHSALHDSLTGLPNRAAFMAKMNDAVQQARNEDRHHVLSFIDLDHFKLVNDTGGHAAGDAVLREIAKVIALSCSRNDMPARLGGDEFAVLFRDCRAEDADGRLRAIIAAISDKEFWWKDTAFRIGASIGATEVMQRSPELSDILHQADKACYRAKQTGRSCLVFHEEQPSEERGVCSVRPDGAPGWANLH